MQSAASGASLGGSSLGGVPLSESSVSLAAPNGLQLPRASSSDPSTLTDELARRLQLAEAQVGRGWRGGGARRNRMQAPALLLRGALIAMPKSCPQGDLPADGADSAGTPDLPSRPDTPPPGGSSGGQEVCYFCEARHDEQVGPSNESKLLPLLPLLLLPCSARRGRERAPGAAPWQRAGRNGRRPSGAVSTSAQASTSYDAEEEGVRREGLVSKWRQKERLKTTAVALVVCLNIGAARRAWLAVLYLFTSPRRLLRLAGAEGLKG